MKHPIPLISLFCLGLLISAVESNAAKLYKWVDADGNISYQDSPPPENAKLLKESTIKAPSPTTSNDTSVTPLTIYTVENCAACEHLTGRLRELEVPFSEQSLMDRDIQSEIISASESLTAPTMKIGNRYFSDLSDNDLLRELESAGYKPNQQRAKNSRLGLDSAPPDEDQP